MVLIFQLLLSEGLSLSCQEKCTVKVYPNYRLYNMYRVFSRRTFGSTEKEGWGNKKQNHALQFCSAVLRKEIEKRWSSRRKMRLRGQKVEKSGENNRDRKHFALDFVRRSQSFPSISASCLPHSSSTERKGAAPEHTHTH